MQLSFLLFFSVPLLGAVSGSLFKRYTVQKKRTEYLTKLSFSSMTQKQKKKISGLKNVQRKLDKTLSKTKLGQRVMIASKQYVLPEDLNVLNLIFINGGLALICWNLSDFLDTAFLPLLLACFILELVIAVFFLSKRKLKDQFDVSFPQLLENIGRVYTIHPDLKQAVRSTRDVTLDPISIRFLDEVNRMAAVGVPIVESLETVASRWAYRPLFGVIASMKLHQSSGGNLGALFSRTSQSIRRQQQSKKAMNSVMFQNKVSSFAVGLLVPIVLLLSFSMSENYRDVILGEPVARTMVVIALFWWAIGVGVLWKMLRVRV